MSNVHTLRLWLEGPMQSWGTQSRFEVRLTERWPSKSGVIGLVCAALGRPRTEPVDDLAALRFGVRVVKPGRAVRDYHSVGAADGDGIAVASGSASGRRGIVTERYYLEEAAFVAAFESSDRGLLEAVETALRAPRWPLALGRRSCTPSVPIARQGALVDADLRTALTTPWHPTDGMPGAGGLVDAGTESWASLDAVEVVLDDPTGSNSVYDQPVGAAFSTRTFVERRVRHEFFAPAAAKEQAA